MRWLYAHVGRVQTCEQVDASFSPFGKPTQVSLQVQLAATCESVWPGRNVFTRIHLMIYFRSIYRLTLVAIESLGTGQNILGAAGRVSRERVGHQLLSPWTGVGRSIFSYQWVNLFYNRIWHTFGKIDRRGIFFQFCDWCTIGMAISCIVKSVQKL